MGDTPILPNGSSTLLPPIRVKGRSKFCQQTPQVTIPILLAIVMLISGGLCMMVLHHVPCKSLKSTAEISSIPTHNSEVDTGTNSSFNKSQKRTHRDDALGAYNLSYFDEHDKINFDAFNQSISNFLLIAERVEESLSVYLKSQTFMLHRELMGIIHQLEYDVQNGLKDLRNLQTRISIN